MWTAMLDQISDYKAGRLVLGGLLERLRGLYVEADPHDAAVRDQFELMWSAIDAQHELRTEPWAPAGSASETTLTRRLDAFAEWAAGVLAADSIPGHR
jgi:hypothetical protein